MKTIWIAEQSETGMQYRPVSDLKALFGNWGSCRDITKSSLNESEAAALLKTKQPACNDLILDCSQAASYASANELEILWANSEIYGQSSQAEKERSWEEAGLVVRSELQNERLYIVRSINLTMLSMQRVTEQLKPLAQAISIERSSNDLIQYEDKHYDNYTLQRIERIAARALHCLDLDAGTVCVALSGTGTVAIRNVWTFADIDYTDDASAAASSLLRLLDASVQKKEHASILIGADPEFILVDPNGKIIAASTYFSKDDAEEFGADVMLVKQGWTHPIAELRPSPSQFPDELLKKVQRLMIKAARQMNDSSIHWLAGGMPKKGMSLGGHIHISGISCTSAILRLLDCYVALPLRLIEDPGGSRRRPKYGALGDFRRQSYGGFEYRTLPSWLVSPAAASIALSLCWLVATEHKQLLQLYQNNAVAKKALESSQHEHRAGALDKLLNQLRSLKSAGQVEKSLMLLQQFVQNRQCWNEQKDIRASWKIPDC